MKDIILATLAAVTLAACGGGSAAPVEDIEVAGELPADDAEEPAAPIDVVLAPANGNIGPNNISFASSESGLEVFITIDGTTKSVSGITEVLAELGVAADIDSSFNLVAGTDLGALAGAFAGNPESDDIELAVAFVGGTDAATASVGVLIGINPQEANGLEDIDIAAGSAFARLTETTLPLTGSATYEGDYVSVLLPTDLADLSTETLAIGGNVTLNANFANALISGNVTDRSFIDLEDRGDDGGVVLEIAIAEVPQQFADITLGETAIDDAGAFAGIASAETSNINGFDVTTEDGAFSGLIAGATGTEAVGAVTVTHTVDGDTFTELGAFAAQQ